MMSTSRTLFATLAAVFLLQCSLVSSTKPLKSQKPQFPEEDSTFWIDELRELTGGGSLPIEPETKAPTTTKTKAPKAMKTKAPKAMKTKAPKAMKTKAPKAMKTTKAPKAMKTTKAPKTTKSPKMMKGKGAQMWTGPSPVAKDGAETSKSVPTESGGSAGWFIDFFLQIFGISTEDENGRRSLRPANE